jgi:hypothetical protein
LDTYKTQDLYARVVDPKGIARYIEKQNPNNELIEWDVVIVNKGSGSSRDSDETHSASIAGYDIGCVIRNPVSPITNELISIKRLVSPPDEVLDLSEDELRAALEYDNEVRHKKVSEKGRPSGIAIRHARPEKRGLLLVYLPTGKYEDKSYGGKGQEIVGWAFSFPASETAKSIDYWATSDYQEEG